MLLLKCMTCIFLYFSGYFFYCHNQIAWTFICAMGSVISLLSFINEFFRGKYRRMTMKKIDQLSGREFEQYLCVQFKRLGYQVKLTDASHDYGADLILKKRRECIVVQAKRYDRNIGIAAVQEVVGAVAYYEADRAMVVTNRYFTRSAWKLAAQNEVELWTRDDIRKNFRIRDEKLPS